MIKVGIGGWNFEPWRGVFYPPGLPQARELEHASRHVSSIEINGTFYRTPSRESFQRWAAETPDDFVFSLKAPRFAVNRRVLAEAGDSIARFFASGVTELGAKLGPILWQLAATKKFDPDDLDKFLALLPPEVDGVRMRHALEVRHASFVTPEFAALAAAHRVAIVFADSDTYPAIADVTGDFIYARLQRTVDDEETGYAAADLDRWAAQARAWEKAAPGGEVFVYMISGAKVRNPAAAMALLERLNP
jgi:uncharacterized protein YecE (DUF72 family)